MNSFKRMDSSGRKETFRKVFYRYAPLIDDFEAFLKASQTPLPKIVWINPLKARSRDIESRILEKCPPAEPLTWRPESWRIPAEFSPGRWPEYHLGLIHCQEEVTLLPILALDPFPGQKILDMCAAPGNKTSQIAVHIKDQGHILANEINWQRLASVQNAVSRLGLTCVAVTEMNGVHLPGQGLFDRVLVDAPCTGEGTSRKKEGWTYNRGPEDWKRLCSLQRGLLKRAVNLTRPGGIIVYCTCTYAPEENEWVVNGISSEQAVLESFDLPGQWKAEAGLTIWQGQEFREDMLNSCRFWPHHNNTGGFFVAKLRRI